MQCTVQCTVYSVHCTVATVYGNYIFCRYYLVWYYIVCQIKYQIDMITLINTCGGPGHVVHMLCTLYICYVHCTYVMYTVHMYKYFRLTLYNVHMFCIYMSGKQYALYNVHWSLYSVQCTVWTIFICYVHMSSVCKVFT